MAPNNGTTSTAPCNGTLVPRPIRQSGSSPSPLIGSKNPYSYRYLGKKLICTITSGGPCYLVVSMMLFEATVPLRFFHGDTMTCLTQWKSASDLSTGCAGSLPKKAREQGLISHLVIWLVKLYENCGHVYLQLWLVCRFSSGFHLFLCSCTQADDDEEASRFMKGAVSCQWNFGSHGSCQNLRPAILIDLTSSLKWLNHFTSSIES